MVTIASRACVAGVLVSLAVTKGIAAEADAPTLEATLCSDAPVANAITDEMVLEAAVILRNAGVTLRLAWRSDRVCRDGASADASHVAVRIDSSPQSDRLPVSKRAIASIQFSDGRPGRTITVSVWAARYLIARDPTSRVMLSRVSDRMKDRWTGRMLGRALAHELGHYLLRSRAHGRTGVMRASHSVQALTDPNRAAFQFTPEERSLLTAVLLQAADAESASR